MRQFIIGSILGVGLIGSAQAQFLEPDVEILGTFESEQAGSNFGWVGGNLQDIDGDGAGDLIIGAINFTTPDFPFPIGFGKVYLYSGATAQEIITHEGQFGFWAGFSVTGMGDVTGDGVPDYAYSEPPVVLIRSGADHSIVQLFFQPDDPTVRYGFDINNAGDLDGDGVNDLLVGSISADFAFNNAGRLYAYSSVSGALLWTVDGASANAQLGAGVGTIGDVDGDGVNDIGVSAPLGGFKGRGVVYVLSGVDGAVIHELRPVGLPAAFGTFGRFFVDGGHDVDADGVNDVYVGDFGARRGQSNPNSPNAITVGTGRAYVFSGATGKRLYVLDAENNGDGFGDGRLIADTNNDGHDDILVAAFQFGDADEGKVYVISGADGSTLRTITGTEPNAQLGIDVLTIDDANGDGKADILITGNEIAYLVAAE